MTDVRVAMREGTDSVPGTPGRLGKQHIIVLPLHCVILNLNPFNLNYLTVYSTQRLYETASNRFGTSHYLY